MLIERANNASRLWQTMMPYIAAPDERQFIRWADRFSDDLLDKAILRTSRRFNPDKMQSGITPDSIHKFATGLLLNLELQADTKPVQQTAPAN